MKLKLIKAVLMDDDGGETQQEKVVKRKISRCSNCHGPIDWSETNPVDPQISGVFEGTCKCPHVLWIFDPEA